MIYVLHIIKYQYTVQQVSKSVYRPHLLLIDIIHNTVKVPEKDYIFSKRYILYALKNYVKKINGCSIY